LYEPELAKLPPDIGIERRKQDYEDRYDLSQLHPLILD
jgi:hypothetical protein